MRDTTAALEEALIDAKAGRLSSVMVFGCLRGADQLKVYNSGADRLQMAGYLSLALLELK